MSVLIFSDLHLDNHRAFSYTTEGGFNSRFIEQLRVLEFLLGKAEDLGIPVIHAGDLFNRRLLLPSDVLHKTYKMLARFPKQTVYLIIGNHDTYSWSSVDTPLAVFKDLKHVQIIDMTAHVYFPPNVDVTMTPHGSLLQEALPSHDKKQVLITHYGVDTARLGPRDFRMQSDLTAKQLKELGYDLVLLGHIHKHQTIGKNIIILGSCMQHSFHETGEDKFYFILDSKTGKLKKRHIPAPKFILHEIRSKKGLEEINVKDGNYHRINVMTPEVTTEDLAPYLARNVVVNFSRTTSYVHEEDYEKKETRTPEEEVEEYYDNLVTDLDKDKLKEIAGRIIK